MPSSQTGNTGPSPPMFSASPTLINMRGVHPRHPVPPLRPVTAQFDLMELQPQRFPTARRGHAGPPGDWPKGECCFGCFVYVSVQASARKDPKCARMRPQWTHGPAPGIRKHDPACTAWEGKVNHATIVQGTRGMFQLSAGGRCQAPDSLPAMIYDREPTHTRRRQLGARDRKMMGDNPMIYREARCTRSRWKLGNRVVSQPW